MTRSALFLASLLLGGLALGCGGDDHLCDMASEKATKDAVPAAWLARGLTFRPGAVVCSGGHDRDVLVVERTAESIALRAGMLRDELRATGWVVLPGKDGPDAASSSYSVILEKGSEALVLTVNPVADSNGRPPAVAIRLGVVPAGRRKP